MLERLGLVIHYTANVIAILLVAVGVGVLFFGTDVSVWALFVSMGLAGITWLIGRAIFYVLAGE